MMDSTEIRMRMAALAEGDSNDEEIEFLRTTVENLLHLAARDTTYNGWRNYPTWNVKLWIDNERALYEEAGRITDIIREQAQTDDNVLTGIWTADEAARFRLADHLKQWVTDELAPDLGASFAADLLGYALGEVDWEEIAIAQLGE